MRKINYLWIRLNHLVPNPQCNTAAEDYDSIEWNDIRPLPSAEEIETIDPVPYLPQTIEAQKAQDIIDNLPSWAQIATAVDNIANLADAKIFLKKLAHITYWLAKNKKD